MYNPWVKVVAGSEDAVSFRDLCPGARFVFRHGSQVYRKHGHDGFYVNCESGLRSRTGMGTAVIPEEEE